MQRIYELKEECKKLLKLSKDPRQNTNSWNETITV